MKRRPIPRHWLRFTSHSDRSDTCGTLGDHREAKEEEEEEEEKKTPPYLRAAAQVLIDGTAVTSER